MTEEKKNKRHRKDEITFYETFDDEIVMITDKGSSGSTETNGSPRHSYAPTPVIPGFYTLSDAFENARHRMKSADDLEADDQEDPIRSETEVSGQLELFEKFENPLVRPVTPGHFSVTSLERSEINPGQMKKSQRTQAGKRLTNDMVSNRTKHYIQAGELIEELTDDEIITEKFYWEQQMKQQAHPFDSILDETMKSLLNEADHSKVRSG